MEPLRRDFAKDFYDVLRFPWQQILDAIAFKRITRRRDHRRRQRRFRWQVGEEKIRQIHAVIKEQPRGSACCARPINSKPSPRRIPKSSVWIAATEKIFARSKMRIKPVSPSATSRPVSGEMICARAHGGKRNCRS